ncbi:FG-GAP-like repeat-containing protein [Lewinella sp. LCG006]|uniref:FG-GAP-like repeat-containing protein n=1 Tax=Lewinella sp. LCG006 TaxID=3231911 RepID=UPI00345F8604
MKKYLLFSLALFLTAWGALLAQPVPVSFTNQGSLLTPVSGGSSNDCAVDMNGDFLDDIVRVKNTGLYIDFQQPDGSFIHQYSPVNFSNSPSWSICAGDLDGNGFNDLLFGGGSAVSFVMANEDGTSYTEYMNPDYIFSQRSTMFDIDLDGNLDAFVCHDVDLSHPYRNVDGLGTMVEDQSLIHTLDMPGNYAAIWVDYNNDGYTDLFITKCRGGAAPGNPFRTNRLYRNNGDGTFTEVGEEANMADNAQSWSTVFEDFDNDGDFDAFIVNHDFQNRFMLNNGDGTFTDIIATTGIAPGDLGAWENASGDFNNDGFVDIFSELDYQLYLNNGDLTFTGQTLPFDEGGIGDFNNDGFLDVIRGNNLHINNANNHNWIKINTQGLISNKNGIGSRVMIYGEWGMQMREVRSGQSFSPMSSLCAHFGIGEATSIDSLVINWPSGIRTVLENPAINTMHNVLEASCTLPAETIEVLGSTAICPGAMVELAAPSGYESILWSTGDTNPTLQVTEPGSYGLVVFDEGGCASIAQNVSITQIIDTPPVIAVDGDVEFCAGGEVSLSIDSGNNPVWSNGMTGETITVQESGVYNVAVDAQCSEEQMQALEAVTVTAFMVAEPVIESVEVDPDGVALLTASGENLTWYDEATGGTPLGSGATLTTSPLTEDATFYVEAGQVFGGGIEMGGKLTPEGPGGVPSVGAYSYFDAYEPFTILTVDVLVPDGQQEGVRTIQLVDESDVVLQTVQVDLALGLQTIELNFEVPEGTGMSLRCPENNLFRNNDQVNYPYPIGTDLGALTTSFYGDNYYYYFYNWQVETPAIACVSTRVPVEVTIVNVNEIPEVETLSLFPNPAQTNLRVEMTLVEKADLQLRLFNALGQVVYQEALTDTALGLQTQDIDVSKLPAGVYQLQLRAGDRTATYKVVVE